MNTPAAAAVTAAITADARYLMLMFRSRTSPRRLRASARAPLTACLQQTRMNCLTEAVVPVDLIDSPVIAADDPEGLAEPAMLPDGRFDNRCGRGMKPVATVSFAPRRRTIRRPQPAANTNPSAAASSGNVRSSSVGVGRRAGAGSHGAAPGFRASQVL